MTAVPHQQDAKLGPTVAVPPLRGQVAGNETDVLHVGEVPRATVVCATGRYRVPLISVRSETCLIDADTELAHTSPHEELASQRQHM